MEHQKGYLDHILVTEQEKKCLQPLTFIIMSQMKRREHQKLAVLLKSQAESP